MQSATFRSRSSKPFPLLLSLKWLSSLILVSLIMPLVTASIPANFASVVKSTPQTANATGTSQLTSTSSSASAVSAQASEKYGQLPLSFEENQGQVDEQVKFFSRGSGYSLFLTPAEMVFSLRKPRPASAKESKLPDLAKFGGLEKPAQSQAQSEEAEAPTVVRMSMPGANPAPQIVGQDELGGRSNYFIGNDPAKWRSDISNYKQVQYKAVYPGIDLVFYGNQQQLEYDWIVAPGANPEVIQLAFQGIDNLKLNEQGELLLHTATGDITQHPPQIYQEINGVRKPVIGNYTLKSSGTNGETPTVGFELADYNKNVALVIDPVLVYSTYLGGSGGDNGYGIAIDAGGNAYITGDTFSTNFPTLNPFQAAYGGGGGGISNVFVTKLNAAGNALVYSTYLGGSSGEFGYGIAVDAGGNAYITGYTSSTNFPLQNPFQAAFGGSQDAFVTKLNAMGNALVYSTYLGGSSSDIGYGIAVDASGSAYVTGNTSSTNFPTRNPFQAVYGNGGDVFVTKLNAAGNALVYSTYLGGSNGDIGYGIAVDASGNAYITGYTSSTNFPLQNPFQAAFGGSGGSGGDAFITKLNTTGNALVYSTYLGGSNGEYGDGIAVDAGGNTYITGNTNSTNFPLQNPFQAVYGGGSYDAFVTKLNATGNALIYSTYLGGSSSDGGGSGIAVDGSGIAVDASGNAYVTGYTGSTNFPLQNPFQAVYGGGGDAFVTKLNATGNALVYSTYLGGSSGERGRGIAVDAGGNAYVTGSTAATNFSTQNPFQAAGGGNYDAFVAKISFNDLVGNGLQYYPLPKPIRLLETRAGQTGFYAPGTPLVANTPRNVLAASVNYLGTTIPANAKALVGNATVVNSGSATGYVTLYPGGTTAPLAANLTYTPGQTVPNSFTVGLGSDGSFNILALTSVDMIIDISGYYAPPATTGLYYHSLPKPIRLLETRPGQAGAFTPGTPLVANSSKNVGAAGVSYQGVNIPANAKALLGNATVVNNTGAGPGFVTLHPGGTSVPLAANLTYDPGQTVPNSFTVGLGSDGSFNIFALTGINIVVDIMGYYSEAATDANGVGLLYQSLAKPIRLLETRPGQAGAFTPGTPLVDNSPKNIVAAGVLYQGVSIPANAKALSGNATVVNSTGAGPGFVTIYPGGVPVPLTANLTYLPAQVVPNSFTVGLGSDGSFNILALTGVHIVIDVSGYFTT